MPKATVLSKDIKEAICKLRTFFEREKNAGKTISMVDKLHDRTATGLGVSLRTVDRVYLESQATGVHTYHTVNIHTQTHTQIYIYLCVCLCVCVFHYCDQCY